jgi:hypothetical protein
VISYDYLHQTVDEMNVGRSRYKPRGPIIPPHTLPFSVTCSILQSGSTEFEDILA